MDVTDILRDRAQPPDGLQRMVMLSFAVHTVFVVAILAVPGTLVGRRAAEPRNVMTISLSGAGEGPRNGGFTAAAAQPVQVQTPPEDASKREPPRPPAAKTPEMVMPTTVATKPAKTPPPIVKNAPDDAKGRMPTRGAETSKGQATAFTGARGQGFGGLSTGGGPGSGSTLDVADFCCPDYLATMIDRVRSGWQNNQGATGMCVIKFTIQRTGQITDASVEKSSGLSTLDLAALRAVIGTRTLNPLPAAFPNPTLGVHLTFEVQMTKTILATMLAVFAAQQQTPPPQQPQPQQPTEVATAITSEGTQPPRLAVPDFIALSNDAETVAIAKIIGQVLWDDLNYEREFLFIPRDVYATIPKASSLAEIPFDRWRELNADGLVTGTVQKKDNQLQVEVRLFNVRGRQSVFGKVYSGSPANPRSYAHMAADEIYQTQRALKGVAQTKLTFVSDRDGETMGGTVERRDVKEVYISDYDGERQQRVTVGRTLNVFPRWSPNGRSIAYTSYRRGTPNIFVSNIYEATLEEVTKGTAENWLPAWSPDGSKFCFASPREGKGYTNLYLVNRDGSGLLKLTDHPSINTSPTWSPSGTQIAFVSDRTGTPQIYVISSDGVGQAQRITASESYADKPTWSSLPYNEIWYTARTGPGNDIKIIDMATRTVRQLTFGEGTNESPVFSPNGRHIAFTSTRLGKKQVFTITRDGRDVRQLTKTGNNEQPDWAR